MELFQKAWMNLLDNELLEDLSKDKAKEEEEKQARLFQEKRIRFINLFSTPQGMEVLSDILQEARFHKRIRTEEDLHYHNFAKRILYLCGGWTPELTFRQDRK